MTKYTLSWLVNVLLLLLSGCVSNETVDDTDINPDVIWGRYAAHYSEESSQLSLHAVFRVGGSTGTSIRLTGDAQVTVDGERLDEFDGDEALINIIGTYYGLNRNNVSPEDRYTFVWTRSDGEQFTQIVNQVGGLQVVSPAAGEQIGNTQSLTVKLDGSLGAGERGEVTLSSETGVISAEISGDTAVFPASDFAFLEPGNVQLQVRTEQSEATTTGHPEEGGERLSSFTSSPIALSLTQDNE